MKRVVSVSLGSSKRDHVVELELLGQRVRVERVGVDGDFEAAKAKFKELESETDVFGLGGAELGINIGKVYYPLRSVQQLIKGIKKPIVDGTGIRKTVETKIASWICEKLPETIAPKRVLFCVASGRYDMMMSFHNAGFKTRFGDAGFILGLPIYTNQLWIAKVVGHTFIPLISRLPFKWLYPTGKSQEMGRPKFQSWFRWATVIADDFHYIRQNLPDDLTGKIIVTNTTTQSDVELLRSRGAAYLCTSTPRFEGRTFGSNVLEATLTAIADSNVPLAPEKIEAMLAKAAIEPTLLKLTE